MTENDTIVALASAHGRGGVAVIRLSGSHAFAITETVTHKPCPHQRGMHMAAFYDDQGETLDQGLVLRFVSPDSFTGEDVVEWQTHGSPYLIEALIRRAIHLGARHAHPGEFSERAFLNGKLALDQAEALCDVIDAGSEQAARAAMRSLKGALSREVDALMQALLMIRVQIEASIDFSDEALSLDGREQVDAQLQQQAQQLKQLIDRCQAGAQLRDGMQIVIVGPPNAGKSSLLNALAMQDRAIVTPHAGTTRDLLESDIQIGGMRLSLVDSAGIRDTEDEIEQQGIQRALDAAQDADAVMVVVPLNDPHAAQTKQRLIEKLVDDTRILWVRSKQDLCPDTSLEAGEIGISAVDGQGLDALRQALLQVSQQHTSDSTGFTARQRHIDALHDAADALSTAHSEWKHEHDDLTAEMLRIARRALGRIVGQEVPDDLLGAIFSHFCIGK